MTAGEVRTGADFDLDYVPSVSIEGFVAVPSESRVQLVLAKADPDSPYQATMSTSPDAEGRFSFRRVQPGHYVIAARAVSFATRATLWGRTEVIVAGDDIEGVNVASSPHSHSRVTWSSKGRRRARRTAERSATCVPLRGRDTTRPRRRSSAQRARPPWPR